MSHSIVGKWGKNLAIRVPMDVARAAGLADGEKVEIEALDGDLVVHRHKARAQAQQDAQNAADEIIAEGYLYSLGGTSIRVLRDEGRRG